METTNDCRKLEQSDPEFAAWLAKYVSDNRNGWLGNGKKHEYWAVALDLVGEGAHEIIADEGRDCCYLNQCLNDSEAVLAVAPMRNPLVVKAQAILVVVILIAMALVDPIFKWGKKTCPQCFGRDLHPFTCESADEPPHYFCNGCNTTWPPRPKAVSLNPLSILERYIHRIWPRLQRLASALGFE